jgi:hypothetical protein
MQQNQGYAEHHRAFINRACTEPCSGLAESCKSRRHLAGGNPKRRIIESKFPIPADLEKCSSRRSVGCHDAQIRRFVTVPGIWPITETLLQGDNQRSDTLQAVEVSAHILD